MSQTERLQIAVAAFDRGELSAEEFMTLLKAIEEAAIALIVEARQAVNFVKGGN